MKDELSSKILSGNLIPVVGAGVSYATARFPNWPGLIKDGLAYVKSRNITDQATIDCAVVHLDKWELTAAAKILKDVMNAPGGEYPAWLETVFAKPNIVSEELKSSLINILPPFILTTNFDTLLSSSLRYREVYTWQDTELIRRANENKSRFIFHLHGSYDKPETTIFGDDDYQRIVEAKGYRLALNAILLQHSLLFVGCSKDGVLDEDFKTAINYMAEALQGTSHRHYLLMRSDEAGTEVTREFLFKYGIQIVDFGTEHDELPTFINSFNPNLEKALHLSKIEIACELAMNEAYGLTQSALPPLASLMGNKASFKEGAEVIRELFDKRQQQSSNNREAFRKQQSFLKSLVDRDKLEVLINSFMEFTWKNTDDPIEIISMAIQANDLLHAVPMETMHRIKRIFPNSIKDSWFDGYLDKYVNLYLDYESKGEKELFNDSYSIKNMVVILKCLKGVLEADPDFVFPELNPRSQMLSHQISDSLVVTIAEEISIRDIDNPDKKLAFISAEEGMMFKDAEMINYRGKELIIGFNKETAFHWDPYKSHFVTPFYIIDIRGDIKKMYSFEDGEGVLITKIYVSNSIRIYKDFVFVEEVLISSDAFGLTWLNHGEFFAYTNSRGADLYIEKNGEKSFLSSDVIWNLMMQIQPLATMLNRKNYGWNDSETNSSEEVDMVPKLSNAFLESVWIKGDEYLAMSIHIYRSILEAPHVVLFFKIIDKAPILKGYCHRENGSVIALDVLDGVNPVLVLGNHGFHQKKINYLQSLDLVTFSDYFTFIERNGVLSYPENNLDFFLIKSIQKTTSAVAYDRINQIYIFQLTSGSYQIYGPLESNIQGISVFRK